MNRSTTCLYILGFLVAVMLCCPVDVRALVAAHLNYNGCNTCHALHGSPSGGYLLDDINTEATCLGCHGPLAPQTNANIHDPITGNPQRITCRECHDAHDNQGGNIKLVGYKWDPETDPGKATTFSSPTIRVEYNAVPSSFQTVVFATRPDDFDRGTTNNGACQICHGVGPAAGSSTDLANHQWGDCVICHMHSDGFKKRQCVECHDVNATLSASAPKMLNKAGATTAAVGGHLQVLKTDSIVGLTNLQWTVQCIQCHIGHSGDVVIPNNATVGINYQKTLGIGLGGNATTGTTEAEICWNCHALAVNGISEWQGFDFNGYTVTNTVPGSKSWATANFDAPGNRIPTRAAVSIHSANDVDTDAVITKVRASSVAHNVDASGRTSNHASFSGTKTLEDVKYIRCSYCHDVHNTYGPNKGATWTFDGVSRVNAPTYLRGKWYENPYYARTAGGGTTAEIPPEAALHEGADYYTDNQNRYTGNDRWGTVTVPRLIANTTGSEKSGGYFIDQNSRWPTRAAGSATYMTVADTAGLCTMCHNLSTDSMDYYPGSSLWRTDIVGWKNGHGNSTLGGSGRASAGNNIFDAALRPEGASPGITNVSGYMGFQGQDDPHVNQWAKDRRPLPWDTSQYSTQPFDGGGSPVQNSGWYNWARAGLQRQANSAQLRGGDYTTWYGGSTNSGIGGDGRDNIRAHNFTCSKCHTPHASGLPALLITNCLDYKVSDFGVNSSAGPTNLGPTASGTGRRNLVAIQAPNNCHRKSSTSTGWHKLAPQQ